MVSRIIVALLIAGAFARGADLDLTPQKQFSELEGTRSEITAFRYGQEFVTWTPPHRWRLVGGSSRVALFPPGATQADGLIERLDLPAATALDATYARTLKAEVAKALPREASALEWAEDEPNSLLLNRHPTYKITGSYTISAQRYTKTIWVCNFAEHQLRFHLTTRAQDFEKLHEPLRQSLYSWQGLK